MRKHACLAALAVAVAGCSSSPVNLGGTGTTTGTAGTTTTGGTGTTTGGTGGLASGAPCSGNAQCHSGVCGIAGSGNCCSVACSTADAQCGASGCDSSGACTYPVGVSCGVACNGSTLTSGSCNVDGACSAGTPAPCANHLVCNQARTACLTSCTSTADCVSGFYCNAGTCSAIQATGPCTSDDACTSGICGISGSGHCCAGPTRCTTTDVTCAATDCDDTGACLYPPSTTACTTPSVCSLGVQSGPTGSCSGAGTCDATTIQCSPYQCGASACLTSCTDDTSCTDGGFCVFPEKACCATRPPNAAVLRVDGETGSDSTLCCGYGDAGACQTLTRAMALISSAQAQNVTILASLDGGGGDWAPAGEVYPVELGWGVELSAPGVYFLDPLGDGGASILDVQVYPSDMLGYASIVGGDAGQLGVGMNAANSVRTADLTAIAVEKGATLYLANALVNGPVGFAGQGAIHVNAGAVLMLGQDQSAAVTGTVNVGSLGGQDTEGFFGIYCDTDGVSAGCTLEDAALVGQSSLVVQGEAVGIYALDYSKVSLSSAPLFGAPPTSAGFGTCPSTETSGTGIALSGPATMTLENATFQCIAGSGVALLASQNGGGAPVATIDKAFIQHAGSAGIYAIDGMATVTNSTFQYNYWGVHQDTDGTNSGSIDLSGGGVGGNTIVCSSVAESNAFTTPGMDVYNSSFLALNASDVAWDTPGPDYYSCDSLFISCTCLNASCSVTPDTDGMSAVEDSTLLGGITTTGNTYVDAGCL